ncbi:TrkH family potassium uptake protein [Anaerosalibacter bizertensis]|uniref:TrkH family potassium uptake protein n=1 Tax=Anaerosalibacter bizertensis TaxID=932217 RepID=A0A844FFH1_9FIRM|nr:TrkH family potassium uptake protein [Anaerosalibacter bizertensis]MSS42721.1 TrkH family potassium uptake protein [Anaerosalibacter bizertensis]
MNYGVVIKILGNLLTVEALLMIPSLLVSLYYNQYDKKAFLISIFITGVLGFIMGRKEETKENIKAKEGLAIVAFGWILASFFGSLPFVLSGSIPSWIDSFFETVSGFTTTGATIVDNVESLPMGILFWRSFTHWIGGMGILVFTIAILPTLGVGGFQIFKVESPGPMPDRIVPKVKDTAKILYITYFIMTVLEIILLLFGGMSLYDAAVHTFGTVGTGGFSIKTASVGAYDSTYIHIIIGIFMILSGVNFSLYYFLFQGKWKEVFKNEELRLYFGIIFSSVILIALNINSEIYKNIGLALRDAFFQVGSIITTTGYATTDFDKWPTFSKSILFLLMFVGGCAGSTGGGIKNIRILVLFKLVKREFSKILHPRAVIPIKTNGEIVSNETVAGITSFFALYIFIFVLGTVLISLEGMDLVSSSSAVASALGNIGPGFGIVGPVETFSSISSMGKLLLSLFMLLGRLELFTIIALVLPKTWRNEIF